MDSRRSSQCQTTPILKQSTLCTQFPQICNTLGYAIPLNPILPGASFTAIPTPKTRPELTLKETPDDFLRRIDFEDLDLSKVGSGRLLKVLHIPGCCISG